MNKTCPKCGADYNGRPAPNQHDYWCGSTTWGYGDFYQSPECVRRERDQLVERIKRMKEAGDEMFKWSERVGKEYWMKAKETKP